jgi:hypothetical protein
MKTLNNSDVSGATKQVKDIEFYGDGDTFHLLCKASSKEEGWMKSTKVCNLPNGCLVQVSTQQGDNVAESVTFVPNVQIDLDSAPRKFVPMYYGFALNAPIDRSDINELTDKLVSAISTLSKQV